MRNLRLPFDDEPGLGFFQAGANDGHTHDWLYQRIVKNQWRGICTEPQETAYQELVENYRHSPQVTTLHCAVAQAQGVRTLYCFEHPDPWLHWKCSMLASFDRDLLLRNARIELAKVPGALEAFNSGSGEYVREVTVPCDTVARLCRQHDLHPDLLALDIEGAEAEVLLGADLAALTPRYVFFEVQHMNKRDRAACVDYLTALGYFIDYVPEYNLPEFNLLATLTRKR